MAGDVKQLLGQTPEKGLMKMEQVITIDNSGGMETLRQKAGQGIDLREFGEIEMQRVSSVDMDEGTQKFFVRFLAGKLEGRELTQGLYGYAQGADIDMADMNKRVYFNEYEDGVQAEIFVLNDVQKKSESYQPELLNLLAPRA